jgi:hypothetical protein
VAFIPYMERRKLAIYLGVFFGQLRAFASLVCGVLASMKLFRVGLEPRGVAM